MTEDSTPQSRAERAIETLVAEGAAVTVQAVRERAGVSNAVATQVARAWKSAANQVSTAVNVVPAALALRGQAALDALWAEARSLAAAEFEAAHTAWEQQLAGAENVAARLADQVEALTEECEHLKASTAEHIAAVKSEAAGTVSAMGQELVQARSRADRAEGALEVMGAERDRLLSELREVRVGVTNADAGPGEATAVASPARS